MVIVTTPFPAMPNLRDLMEAASLYVERSFARYGQFATGTFHAMTADELCLIVPLPDVGDTDLSLTLVRELFVAKDVVAYVFAMEGWAVQGTFKSEAEAEAVDPEDHPDGREVVLLSAESELEGMLLAHRQIIRPPRARAYLAPLEYLPGEQFQGRVFGMLARRTTLQ